MATCTYDADNPDADNTSIVRTYIGDTSTTNCHFTDGQIELFLSESAISGTEVPIVAAARALRAWGAELSRKALMIKSATFAKDTRGRAKEMDEKADALEQEYALLPASYTAEIGQTDEESMRIAYNRALREQS